MEFSLDGLEEFYTDGVLNPRATSVLYQESCTKYRELADRVFLLYAPPTSSADPSGACGAEFDVVLLHGIGSDEFKCWTNQQGVLWPAVFLPQDFSTARVLTVGYAHSLFNWAAKEASDALVQAAAVAPDAVAAAAATDSTPAATAAAVEKEVDHGLLLRPIRALARKVEQSTRESVSTYAPEQLSEWWRRPTEAAPPSATSSVAAPSAPAATAAGTSQEDTGSSPTSADAQPTAGASAAGHENPLFQLLARIRDSTGSLVSAEDGAPSVPHSHADSEAQAEASASSAPAAAAATAAAAARDPRSLQSMRLVAAEVAERLLSPAVGVGQRPLVFMVHSMGGLILKQMLISLFEAARLSPPPVTPISITRGKSPERALTVQHDAAQAESHEAIRQASMLLRSVRGVVFYGTPHFGSAMASVITGLKKYYQGLGGLNPTSVVTGLGDHNKAELTRLNDRFFDVVERLGTERPFEESGAAVAASATGAASAADFVAAMTSSLTPAPASVWSAAAVDGGRDAARCGPVCVLSFGETRKLNGLVRVVEPDSANPAPEDPRYPFYLVNADHSEINRPVTKTSPSYAMLYGLLDRMQQRGLLDGGTAARRTLSTSAAATPSAAALPSPSPTGDGDTVRRLQQRYEAGWATLFDSVPTAAGGEAKVAAPADPDESASRPPAHSASVAAYVRGVGEAQLALPLLGAALEELRRLLRRFFGIAVPPQLDAVFLLAADMREFVDGFYSHERLADGIAAGTAPLATEELTSSQGRPTPVDEVVSFRVPLQMVLYWARQATRMLRGFEKSQGERALRIGGGAGSDSAAAAAAWEASTMLHPSSRDFRELGELEQSVGVVREDWEGFRRYVSLRVRAATAFSAGPSQESAEAGKAAQPLTASPASAEAPVADHIASLFFARTLRAVIADQLHDGGALGGLLGAYLRSAILQVRGAESQLSSTHLEHNVWLPLLRAPSRSASASSSSAGGSLVSLLMEGLELAAPSSRTTTDGSVLVDTSGHRVNLSTAAELRAITPALTATSATLMGCFALYVDETHHLDAAARGSAAATAAHHFRRAVAAMEADGRVRARLLRAAARTMQRGPPPPPAPSSSSSRSGRGDAEWDWWRAARQLTAPKTVPPAAGTAAGGGLGQDGMAMLVEEHGPPCSHVGVLDDGLFLSALQLVSAALQCTSAIAACQSQVSAGPGVVGAAVPEAELMHAVEVGRKAYERTAQLVRGVLVIEDTEQPFGASRKRMALHTSGSDPDAAEERSAKERFRDTIRGLLKELESDEATEEGKGDADAAAAAASTTQHDQAPTSAVARPSKPVTLPTSRAGVKPKSSKRVSSLPMFVMNSLSKAWAAVRHGGVSVETPEYLAFNAMLLWWTAEWKAAAVLRASAAAGLPDPALRQRVHETLVAAEKTRQRRWAAASAREAGPEERECWSHTNAALRCGVLTLGGADQVLHGLRSGLAEERVALNGVLDSTSVDALRAAGAGAGDPSALCALAQVGGGAAAGVQQAVPKALLDAVRAEDTNAALRCWLGHCYALHRVASPDAAHAYIQVIRNDLSRAQVYATAAEVGLAWSHLHRVPCASLQLWREGYPSQSTGAAATLNAREIASALLSYDGGAVVDTSALRSAPPALARFFRSAVLHHTEAVHAYAQARSPGAPPCHPRLKCQALTTHASRSPNAAFEAVDRVPDADARHLRFAEEGFQRALQADPRNVGALCGLGRLRSLAAGCGSLASCATIGSSAGGAGLDANVWTNRGPSCTTTGLEATAAGGVRVADAQAYFAAALAAAAEHDVAAGRAAALPFDAAAVHGNSHARALDGVWRSYAAYWMSEECGRHSATDAARLWLRQAIAFYPRNDWALTSLGLSLLREAAEESSVAATALSPPCSSPQSTAEQAAPSALRVPASAGARDAGPRVHRGLALLQRALVLNPTNTWALWGVGTYAAASPHRDACQRLLRNLVVKGLRGRR